MMEIDLTQYASANDADDAGEAAFVAANPEPTKPEKTFEIQRPVLIEAGTSRLWVEVRQRTAWGGSPEDPDFYLRSHDLSDSAEMKAGEIKTLIEQLTLKLSEFESAEKYKAEYSAYQAAHRQWESKKNEAGTAARTAWRALQKELNPTPKADDYSHEDIEVDQDYDEDDFDDDDSEEEDEDL